MKGKLTNFKISIWPFCVSHVILLHNYVSWIDPLYVVQCFLSFAVGKQFSDTFYKWIKMIDYFFIWFVMSNYYQFNQYILCFNKMLLNVAIHFT